MTLAVRKVDRGDEQRWRELWDAYCRFYERESCEDVTNRTWARIMDVTSLVKAIVATDKQDGVVGIANYIVHESTSTLTPVCYLQDLFVDPSFRGGGAGRLLMDLWRKRQANGDVVVVRYADDTVLGFQYQPEADRFREDLRQRLAKFGLELHPDKTRRIEFGRHTQERRERRGKASPRPSTFWASRTSAGRTGTGPSS